MRRTWPVLLLAIVLSLVGVYLSFNLLAKHYAKSTGLGWFDAVCEGTEQSSRSCDQVLASDYGLFPAVRADTPIEQKYAPVAVGFLRLRPRPVALYGMMYFSVLAGWYLAIGRLSFSRRKLHFAPLLFNAGGVLGALYFIYVMFSRIEAWCPWCMVTHVLNGLLLVCAILLWPRRPAGAGGGRDAQKPAATPRAGKQKPAPAAADVQVGHPSLRIVLIAVGGIIAVVAAEWYLGNVAHANEMLAYQKTYVTAFNKQASKLMYGLYQSNTKHQIPRRPDDPVKNEGAPRLSLVVFSDLQCPHCATFAEYLDQRIEPLFDGLLRVTFRHFPANRACNQHVVKDLHPGACQAARAAEAVHLLGGNEGFWKAHDLLFELRSAGDKLDYRDLARRLGHDPQRFVETMDSQAVIDRISEDIELAKKIGVDATPALFLSGRRVPRLAVRQPLFWRTAQAHLNRILQAKARQQDQAQKKTAPTDSQPEPDAGN